ncbi:uncharacterized protein LOC111386465, partial [Olea europaea var. sylvestris]|uniref:uncharacterized protein LOC111386465 n=1 Tax=Olea europaea var. sylvestris TaxID=158386 RepID=UPI000C1D2EEC
VFHSRESLCNWVRMVGKELRLVTVIIHSERGGYGHKSRIRYGCEHSGKYKKHKNHSNHEPKRKRSVGTRKCKCPFDLNGVKLSTENNWMLKVSFRLHNHPLAQHLEGHPYVQRLINEEEHILIDMSKSLVKPRNISMTLKEWDPNNVSIMRTIYNARARHRLIEKAGKTQMQQIMSKLKEHNYIEWHRSHERTDEVRDLFFAHPTSIDFLHAFSCVLIMDCTHKTNRYGRPLFEIVGVTST